MTRYLLALLMILFAAPALAQTEQEDRAFFLGFVEDQLSGPNRQIRINDIQGILSSNATIGEITVADDEGVWLRIVNAGIDWSRSALLFGRLDINVLRADRIEVSRRPVPAEGAPAPEAAGFQLPELPLAINLGSLEIERLVFGEDVFGLASELSAEGSLQLAAGALDTTLQMQRLDGPGGQLSLTASYSNQTEVLGVDFALSEPENGVVANLLGIEGRPPVDLALSGEGPLGDLELTLALDADGERVLSGVTRLDQTGEGLDFNARLEGPISRLVAPAYRPFFGPHTELTASGLAREGGGLTLRALNLDSAGLELAASAETSPDGFLRRLVMDARVAHDDGTPVVLPVPGASTLVDNARLSLNYGEAGDGEWSGALEMTRLVTETLTVERTALDLGGLLQNIDQPLQRRITFRLNGGAQGIDSPREDIAEALGDAVTLDFAGLWQAGSPLIVERGGVAGANFDLSVAGSLAEGSFRGDYALETSNAAAFSGLAGRDLGGAVRLAATGLTSPITGAFDLDLDMRAEDLRVGLPQADNLLAGVTTITGRVARGETGLTVEELAVANQQIELTADGTIATGAADFTFDMALADLALVADRASGRLTATGRAIGSEGRIALDFGARVPSGRLAGRRLADAALTFEGFLENGEVDGLVGGTAFLDGVRAELSTRIATADGARRLDGLDFTAGGARLTGDLLQATDGLLTGRLALDAADVSTAAALLLLEARGGVRASIDLDGRDGQQNADISATISALVVEGTRIGRATAQARLEDLFGVPAVEGRIEAADVVAAGVEIDRLDATASRRGEATDFTADARLRNGATLTTAGSLAPEGEGLRLRLERAALAWRELSARLVGAASLTIVGETVTLEPLALQVGGGRIDASGRIGETFDIDLRIADLPLAIANAVRPDLALGGTVNGQARITGPRARPDVGFELRGRGVTAAALRDVGLGALAVDATGRTVGDRLTLDASASGGGFSARAAGTVPLGDGALALDVTLESFPLATLNAMAPGQALSGTISGRARVTGSLADPQASFDLSGAGVSAAPLAELGAAPLNLAARGRYADERIVLDAAQATGPLGLTLSGAGTIPLAGPGLSVGVDANLPLALGNRLLIDRGTQLAGNLAVRVRVTGSIAQPQFEGDIAASGATLVDPEANVRLTSIALSAGLSGQAVTIRALTASIAGGGTVRAEGTIGIDAAAGFPASLRVALDQARYADGNFVVATLNGAISVEGALARDPLISGTINVARAEISVAGSLGGPTAIDVRHVNPPARVSATLRRARADDGTPTPSARPSVARLDVRVVAPNQIFVRGRGLDAELGGEVRLTGPVTSIQPVGAFNLIRGRLSILGQRITFDEGTITLIGDLDPFIDFVARSEGADITVFITVRGRVSDPVIEFSAQPELPQDEVLARLIFNRGVTELSPLQIAQLAAAAAELAGGSDTSLLQSLRGATGLDDLDIVTDSEGNAAVRAGRYIQDNVYLGVEAGASGTTRATINLDITQDLRARGTVGTDGETGLGIFFERDY